MATTAQKIGTFGHLAYTSEARLAVVVLQEWWGLNDQIRAVCSRLQALGHSAFAPDLYRGKNTLDEAEAAHLMEGLDWNGACDTDIAVAVKFLRKTHDRVAVIGFCMGGALALTAGTRVEGIDGVVSYYGVAPGGIEAGRELTMPFLGQFANRDDWITPAVVDELEQQLIRQKANYTIHRYAADHAFSNENSANYDQVAAALAWERTTEFLKAL